MRPNDASRRNWRPIATRSSLRWRSASYSFMRRREGRTELQTREVIEWGKPVYALPHDANASLLNYGAIPATSEENLFGER